MIHAGGARQVSTEVRQASPADGFEQNLPPVQSADYGRTPSPALVIGLIIAYCVAHYLIRLFTSPVFSLDEAEQLLMSQSLDLGYRFRHPPLITWIYALADMTVGLSRPVFFAIKYIIMAVGLIAFYQAARIVFRWFDPNSVYLRPRNDLSAAATAAWALVYYPAWGHHEDLMHTVLLFTMLAATLHAFFAALASQTKHDWIYFGATIGLGFLSKYVHIMLPVSLFLAALTIPELARGRTDRNGVYQASRLPVHGVALAIGTALVIIAPYMSWVWVNELSLTHLARDVTAAGGIEQAAQSASPIKDALFARRDGVLSLIQALIEFTLPLPVIFLILFWPMWMPYVVPFFPRRHVQEDETDVIWRKLMVRSMLIGVAIYLFVVLLGAQSFKARWMHQVLMPLPIWLFLQVQRSGPYFISMRGFSFMVALFVAGVMGGRFVEWTQDIKGCDVAKCRAYLPVKDWADALREEGFIRGTIVGAEYQLLGNLRYQIREARVLDAEFAYDSFPEPSGDNGACMAVWRGDPSMPLELSSYLVQEMKMPPPDISPQGAIRRNLLMSEDKAAVLYYSFLPTSDTCR